MGPYPQGVTVWLDLLGCAGPRLMRNTLGTAGGYSMASGSTPGSALGLWIAIGVAVGAGLGVVTHNVAVGVGIGLAIGTAVGVAMQQQGRKVARMSSGIAIGEHGRPV